MSINWVMLDSSTHDFVRLPRERSLITSPKRTALYLKSPNSYPGKEPINVQSSDGKATITNQRLIYLPANPTPQFQSLSVPLLSLQDTRVTAPFFGPNVWEGILIPTAGGGFAAQHHVIQIKLTFKEGGAFDFQSTFEGIKEQVSHAAELARENGRPSNPTDGPIDIDLEQLPAYEEIGSAVPSQPTSSAVPANHAPVQRPIPIAPDGGTRPSQPTLPTQTAPNQPSNESRPTASPNEPPPGYEEVQSRSVANNLEQRLREEQSHA